MGVLITDEGTGSRFLTDLLGQDYLTISGDKYHDSAAAGLGVGSSRTRQRADCGRQWLEAIQREMNLPEDEIVRSLLEQRPPIVDSDGELTGKAAEVIGRFPLAGLYPLIGVRLIERNLPLWKFPRALFELTVQHELRVGNPYRDAAGRLATKHNGGPPRRGGHKRRNT